MVVGGFSSGDEPDGSGKFIANVLSNPKVSCRRTDAAGQRRSDPGHLQRFPGIDQIRSVAIWGHRKTECRFTDIVPQQYQQTRITYGENAHHIQ